jgi:hypothetical protein
VTELHTVIAKCSTVAERTRKELTEVHRSAQHAPNFMGNVREMVSFKDDVPDEPPEITLPVLTAHQIFQRMTKILTNAWDITATRDRTNMDAQADIVVDGATLAEGVPVSTLLYLEKQLVDARTVVNAVPVRDPSRVWTFDEDQGFHRAPEMRKPKTRKVVKGATLYEATDKHPAQVQAFNTDEPVGHYVMTEFSGAISAQERQSLVDRLNTLIDAVKEARTEANRTEVTDVRLASELLGYVFAR